LLIATTLYSNTRQQVVCCFDLLLGHVAGVDGEKVDTDIEHILHSACISIGQCVKIVSSISSLELQISCKL